MQNSNTRGTDIKTVFLGRSS